MKINSRTGTAIRTSWLELDACKPASPARLAPEHMWERGDMLFAQALIALLFAELYGDKRPSGLALLLVPICHAALTAGVSLLIRMLVGDFPTRIPPGNSCLARNRKNNKITRFSAAIIRQAATFVSERGRDASEALQPCPGLASEYPVSVEYLV